VISHVEPFVNSFTGGCCGRDRMVVGITLMARCIWCTIMW